MRLHIVPAQESPFEHLWDDGELVIGRAAECGLTIPDRFLSRRHARLYREGGLALVEDLGSRNGTLVNGERIAGPTPVVGGDVIRISGSQIALVDEERAAAASESALYRPATQLLADRSLVSSTVQDAAELRHLAEQLELLNEVHRALARPIAITALLELILDRAFDHLRPEQAAILLKGRDGELTVAAARAVPGREGGITTSRSLAQEVVGRGNAALILDAQTDQRFASAASILSSGVRSLIAAPLLDEQGTLGMIALQSKLSIRQFTEADLELLVSLAAIAGLRLRNLALADEAAERRRLEQELALARRIQVALLPERLPEPAGWELHSASLPSRGVSGDSYKALLRARPGADAAGELVLMLADVSGKGMSASLLSASLEALSAAPIEDGLGAAEICTKLSRLLWARTPPEKYATCFFAVLDLASGRLTWANAGHNPGLLVRASGEVAELASSGPPLGLLAVAAFRESTLELAPGDSLVLYTDGISEAANAAGDEYGVGRLASLAGRLATATAGGPPLAGLWNTLAAELDAFVGGEPYADDRTFLAVRRAAS
jgi:serine phosphatase RsbU (regulator of sigma subunit)